MNLSDELKRKSIFFILDSPEPLEPPACLRPKVCFVQITASTASHCTQPDLMFTLGMLYNRLPSVVLFTRDPLGQAARLAGYNLRNIVSIAELATFSLHSLGQLFPQESE